MKRPIMIAVWSIAGLVFSLLAYGLIALIIYFVLTAAKVARLDLAITVAIYIGWLVPFAGLTTAAILALRGRLPGTKSGQ